VRNSGVGFARFFMIEVARILGVGCVPYFFRELQKATGKGTKRQWEKETWEKKRNATLQSLHHQLPSSIIQSAPLPNRPLREFAWSQLKLLRGSAEIHRAVFSQR
jgi:hypothetical protein